MSIDDFDRMERFDDRFSDVSMNEESLRRLGEEFGDFFPAFLTRDPIDVPERASTWTESYIDNPMDGNVEKERS